MRSLAARAFILWDLVNTIMAGDDERSVVSSVVKNARCLEEALDRAVEVGLLTSVVGNREHSLILYSVTQQALMNVGQSVTQIDEHLTLALIRVLDVCREYRTPVLPASVLQRVGGKLDLLQEVAWTYLDHPEQSRQKFQDLLECVRAARSDAGCGSSS